MVSLVVSACYTKDHRKRTNGLIYIFVYFAAVTIRDIICHCRIVSHVVLLREAPSRSEKCFLLPDAYMECHIHFIRILTSRPPSPLCDNALNRTIDDVDSSYLSSA